MEIGYNYITSPNIIRKNEITYSFMVFFGDTDTGN